MLVLTRRPKETIIMVDGKEIKITVLSVRGDQVQLGIDAPREIAVHREEVFERIKALEENGE